MKIRLGFLLILLINVFCLTQYTNSNEVLGCGGFIKSHADIDFSKVEIKLYTKQGSLKDKTDCSPSNGYYFLPIYDNGNYILKVSPPPGWSFEPQQVELNFDGKSDICSLGNDVNFAFKGFGITGKVALAGQENGGAHEVEVLLQSADGNDIRKTKTDLNGVFSFTPIIPGKYIVRASHAKWQFSKSEYTVTVASGNTVLPENALIVSGFDVSGHFDTNGQLSSGIGVALYKQKGQTLTLPCHTQPPVDLKSNDDNYETVAACYAQVDKSGDYSFKGVPPGKYLLQPLNENNKLKLHLSTQAIEFQVLKDTLYIKDEFKITGFSVSGKVLTAVQGPPIKGAIVKLNGQKVTETGSDGSYTLDKIKAGTYTLEMEAPQVQFELTQVKLQISNPTLPTIVPKAFEVCGKVVSTKSYVVGITKFGSTFHTTATTKAETGTWCTYLAIGKYKIEVLTTEADKNSGVQFFPVQQQIDVVDRPLSGTTFSQLRAKIRGEIQCLPDATSACFDAEVTLQALDISGQPTTNKLMVKAHRGKYIFKDVLPGPYEITVPQSNFCYDSTRVLLNVASTEETALPIVQNGYEVSIISSHRALIKYSHITSGADGAPTSTGSLKLQSGLNTFCVPKYGSYNFKVEGCHQYDDTLPTTFVTPEGDQLSTLIINAVAHKIGVRVLSTESTVDTLKLLLESEAEGKETVTPVPVAQKVDGKYAYRYDTYLKPEQKLSITPQSDLLLFTPQSKEIVGGKDCVDIAFDFIAARGLIIRGKIVPAIKDTKITLSYPNNEQNLTPETTLTTITGEFKFGPIEKSLVYELNAEKESYVFSEYNHQTSSFSAHKLCEIVVQVKDDVGKPLGGVLLSLSGAESYRKNLITSDDGIINFHSLSPSQYFLRPMMKEYKFEPISKMIDIKDGATTTVELVGKRFAYSVFGTITSLNGEPFPQVNIEAIADEKCMHQQEEATSEANGNYRLRGLQPGCNYTIRLKDLGVQKSNVKRFIPATRTVEVHTEDIRSINMIAVNPITIVDVIARVTASHNDHYKTLRIVMYRRSEPDNPTYSQRVSSPLNPKLSFNPGIMIYFPRIPLDGAVYIVELKSTLSDKSYTYKLPSQQFVANISSVFVELDFKPEVRAVESDLNQNSISALILVALVSIAFFRQDLAMDFLNFVWSKGNAIIENITQKQKNSKKDTRKNEPISQREIEQMAEQINAIKKKKTKRI